MQGSIVKRMGKNGNPIYYVVVPVGDKRRWIKAGPLKHEAERLLRDTVAERERGFYKDLKRAPFKQLAEQWMENHKLDKKLSTIRLYQDELKVHLLPYFGERIVSEITPAMVEAFKHETAKKVSATTTNYNLMILGSIFKMGTRLGYCYNNPLLQVDRMKQKHKTFNTLTKEELDRLLESAEGQGKLLLMTAGMSGMRMGEVLAMKWKNLDFEKGVYSVKESFSNFGLSSPKTETSARLVALPPVLVQALRKRKVTQMEERLASGGSFKDQGLVFTAENGSPVNPSNLRNRIFYPAMKKAGLAGKIRFHDLRRCFASLALEAGLNPKFVQGQLGHTTIKMTMETYARVNSEKAREEIEKFNAYLTSGLTQ